MESNAHNFVLEWLQNKTVIKYYQIKIGHKMKIMKKTLWLFILPVLVVVSCSKDEDPPMGDPCEDLNLTSIFIRGDYTMNMFTNMTNTGGNNWEYQVAQLKAESINFIFANNSSGNNATWGDNPTSTGSSMSGTASKKVEAGGQIICGENKEFSITDESLLNKKITITFNSNTLAYTVTSDISDACDEYETEKMWIFWRLDDADPGSSDFEEMTRIGPGLFEIEKKNFQPCCGAWPIKFVNTPDFTQVDWGREQGFSPSPNFDPLTRKAGRKVIDPILENGVKVGETLVCGGNGVIRIPTADSEGKNIRVIFDANTEEYQWIIEEPDPCVDFNRSRMWINWRLDDADPGSFGFQEMTEIEPGVFQVIRENFQPCCGAWAVKFVNTNDWTQADWGREPGFTPSPNFDPLSRITGRKVVDPVLENGVKVGEELICGGNSNIRFPTAGSEGKTIRVIFDVNTEEYAWIVED